MLRQVMLPMLDWDKCRALSSSYEYYLNPDNVCAGVPATGNKSICSGDSGGPLVCKQGDTWFQYGISSWLFTCTEPGHVSVFQSVVSFRWWIEEKTGGLYLCTKTKRSSATAEKQRVSCACPIVHLGWLADRAMH